MKIRIEPPSALPGEIDVGNHRVTLFEAHTGVGLRVGDHLFEIAQRDNGIEVLCDGAPWRDAAPNSDDDVVRTAEIEYIADGAPTGHIVTRILEELGVDPKGQRLRLRICLLGENDAQDDPFS